MLHAIGIYTEIESKDAAPKKLKKVISAQQEKPESMLKAPSQLFFSSNTTPVNQLKNVDELLLNSNYYETEMTPGMLYKFRASHGEINYIFQPVNQPFIMAISSRTKLDASEKVYLFKNIEHIYLRPDSIKTTLDDIITNPLGYTGKDILIGRIQKEIDEVIAVMHDNIEKVIKRGEALDELESKALSLSEHSLQFRKGAERLNEGCCGATVRYVNPWSS